MSKRKEQKKVEHSKELLGVSGEPLTTLLIGKNKKDALERPMQPPKITRLPQSSVLERVSAFLPQMAQANQQLEKEIALQPPGTFDIEVVDQEKPHVEMALSLGVFNSDDSDEDGAESEEEEGQAGVKKARIVELKGDGK
eukprot:comp5003_c0_seq1/m.1101 comp5003_c0_seq1/g.1101  ORF comp5003_c0_seq1/g.1101 comp5003_c0_seq1/m.1101 type:complete len:140 (-) comp5003_c0_seq1:213-632(-)